MEICCYQNWLGRVLLQMTPHQWWMVYGGKGRCKCTEIQNQKTETKCQKRREKHRCHHHFWKFAKELLDDKSSSQVVPSFTEPQASSYSREIYQSGPRNFDQPDWLPVAPTPEVELDCEEFAPEEIQIAMKCSKSSSTPSPMEHISFQIFKHCPSLSAALLDLFNLCWSQVAVPAIKLIGKRSATEDPTSPINFLYILHRQVIHNRPEKPLAVLYDLL